MTYGLKRFEYINNLSRRSPWINLVKRKEVGGPVPVAKKEEEEEYLLLGMIVLIAIILLPVVIVAFDHGYVQLFPNWVTTSFFLPLSHTKFSVGCGEQHSWLTLPSWTWTRLITVCIDFINNH